ncbi:MAG: DUF4920 domain-containing protein [Phycisphaerales bacterium]
MRRLIVSSILLAASVAGCAPKTAQETALKDGWPRFGTGDDPTTVRLVAVAEVPVTSERIAVTGVAARTSQRNGEWIVLRDDAGDEIVVRFRDYRFFAPRNATGRHVLACGTASRETLSVEDRRRMVIDGGGTISDAQVITEPKDVVLLIADTIWIQGPGLVDPYRPVGAEGLSPPLPPTPASPPDAPAR